MKNILLLMISCLCVRGGVSAQFKISEKSINVSEQSIRTVNVEKDDEHAYPLNWHLLSYEEDSLYGAEVEKAYEFLKGKEKKKKVIVAIIDSGCDDLHEDLKDVLWVNRGEIVGDGVDNDGNGYVDDVHGWNFLGTRDGMCIEETMEEGASAFLKVRERFEYLLVKERNKKEEKEYQGILLLLKKSQLGQKFLEVANNHELGRYVEIFDKELKVKYPGEKITLEKFMTLVSPEDSNSIRKTAHVLCAMGWGMRSNLTWEEVYADRYNSEKIVRQEAEKLLARQKDERHLIGDDLNDIKDSFYGNAVLLSSGSDHGTHVAGIVGAKRHNGIGMDGVADHVELMVIRAIPGGDEYDKDIALAIRYAVNHGANIINMSFGKKHSSHPKWVFDAMRYAESKGVLLVRGAGNDHANCDELMLYPVTSWGNKKISNLITVGSSDMEGQPAVTSNYGKKNVDVFAPGVGIYSTIPGNKYMEMGGTSMATPVISGVAAMLMTYYPELNAGQVRDIILKSAVIRQGELVSLPQDPMRTSSRKQIPFSDLCVGGGVVSALEAVKLADKIVNQK